MSRINYTQIENLVVKFRSMVGLSSYEPVHVKTVLLKLGIIAKYRPLSDKTFGLSLKTPDDRFKFILINSNSRRGRQHFTIAHELYHLYYDPNPQPHICDGEERDKSEMEANTFASILLMPQEGVINLIPDEELRSQKLKVGTVLRLEQFFSVSHEAMVNRLRTLKLISESQRKELLDMTITDVASVYGFDLSLYRKGNENLLLGDYGEKLRELYNRQIISEGHYWELHKLIYND